MCGESRGNPGESTYSFCVRNSDGNLIHAEAQRIGRATSMEAKVRAILSALKFCKNNSITNVIVETGSLSITKMIRKEWKVP
ncbi:hypothetical protein R3W88_022349 [Solanum pinnatisectum]|uniref:RNase H type-1 domain-containing protein n=1 Tax=Solanum pinnatisectum TaxID=50273 RepID=A0AAV9LUE5_9SOLN|nr:hypothetical protein R3W88_022349 [Solanum pinnatisectum]